MLLPEHGCQVARFCVFANRMLRDSKCVSYLKALIISQQNKEQTNTNSNV